MKILQGAAQASGYWHTRLVDPEDLDLLRFEETGELPEGVDFAVQLDGVWRDGRCYASSPGRTFVTYGDAQRLALHPGMEVRLPLYTLDAEQLLKLARTYARELGYTPTQKGTIIGECESIASGESTDVAVPLGNERPLLVVSILLKSSGDIRLLANSEPFLATPPPDPENSVG
jgi:hypothetical protein